MAKITCSICRNEENKMCKVKKIGIHVKKRRNCDKFVMEPDKIKASDIIETIKVPYAEREEAKKRLKEQMKLMRAGGSNVVNAHPLTGDLSRFTSTAAKE
jgi:hypothetical protein